VANQIAAGEVIERPAAVVKELIENAIDAGATQVDIEFYNAGLELIKVSDNGSGMTKDEVLLALQPHATSKIRTTKDLTSLRTLGFRGEALPSIAAISKLDIFAMPQDPNIISGISVKTEGGNIVSIDKQGGPKGTIVSVKDLFYNTPARLKYLRRPQTETKHIIEATLRLALSHPQVAFSLRRGHRTDLITSGNGRLQDVIIRAFGNDIWKDLIQVDEIGKSIEIAGYISRPALNRSNRSLQYIFVNNRFVRSPLLISLLNDAYRGLLPLKRHPIAFLNLTLDPEQIDVNVHPTKLEVRFSSEREIANAVRIAINGALQSTPLIPGLTNRWQLRERTNTNYPTPAPPERISIDKGEAASRKLQDNSDTLQNVVLPPPDLGPLEKGTSSRNPNFPNLTSIGQVYNTYIIARDDISLFIIDQHAAHERVVYEELVSKDQNKKDENRQHLLVSQTIELSQAELEILLENHGHFSNMGFEVEEFGGREVIIRSAPLVVPKGKEVDIFLALLNDLRKNHKGSNSLAEIKDQAQILLACHSSIRSGKKLSKEEMNKLLLELAYTKQPFTCPHGRPTVIHISETELEKRFMRL
jgi:DNA mismatch repair protein MutL